MGKLLFLPSVAPAPAPVRAAGLWPSADAGTFAVTVEIPGQLAAPVTLRYSLDAALALYERFGAALHRAQEADAAARRRALGQVRLAWWGVRRGRPHRLVTVLARAQAVTAETVALGIAGDRFGRHATRHDGRCVHVQRASGVEVGVAPGRRVWKVEPEDLAILDELARAVAPR